MFTHDAMGHWIDPSWWTHWAIFRSCLCSMTSVTKVVVCNPVYGMVYIKAPLLLTKKSSPCGGSSRLLSDYMSGLHHMSDTIYLWTMWGVLCPPAALISPSGNVLFNDTLNTFYLRLYGIRHMVKDHSDSERDIFYLTTHSTHFIYGYMASGIW